MADSTVRRALARLDFVWCRPRLYIYERDPAYAERMAAVEQALDEEQVTALFEDETDVRRFPVLRSIWMKRGEQARIGVPDQNGKFALYGVIDPETGACFTSAYEKGQSAYTISFLDEIMDRFEGEVVLVWDQARWHTSGAVEAALAGYDRLRVLLLPKRSPQQNPIEDLWCRMKNVVSANLERSLEALKQACARYFERLSNQEVLRLTGLAA